MDPGRHTKTTKEIPISCEWTPEGDFYLVDTETNLPIVEVRLNSDTLRKAVIDPGERKVVAEQLMKLFAFTEHPFQEGLERLRSEPASASG